MEDDPFEGEPAKNGPPGLVQEARLQFGAKRIGRPS